MANYKQGSVYWYDFGPKRRKGVHAGMHPCVIMSNNIYGRYSPSVNVVVLSTKKKENPVHVLLTKCPGLATCYAYCEQVFTVNKEDFKEYIGILPKADIFRVLDKLWYQFTYKSGFERR